MRPPPRIRGKRKESREKTRAGDHFSITLVAAVCYGEMRYWVRYIKVIILSKLKIDLSYCIGGKQSKGGK